MRRRARTTAIAGCLLLVAASCGDDDSGTGSTNGTQAGTNAPASTDDGQGTVSVAPSSDGTTAGAPTEEALLEAARAAALEAAGGEEIGGSVSLLGVLGGEELDDFLEVLVPFEEATGITVEYEGTRDFGAILQTRVEGGNPPDVVSTPALGQMADLADQGEVVDLNELVGADQLSANFSPSLIETASTGDQVYGIFSTVNLGGLIWYDPNVYDGPTEPESWDALIEWSRDKAAADGVTPWCIGLESGAASGWPAADFIDDILLRQAGPEFHERWWRGEVPWTAPEVKRAYETYGEFATDETLTYGGVTTSLTLNFANGADAMYSDPPQCYLHQQATFMGGIITSNFPELEPGVDLDFFPAPTFNPKFDGIQSVSGEIISVLNETEQSVALARYMATPEAGSLVGATGRWLSPNSQVEAEIYTDPFLRRASEVLQQASGTHYLGNALMPTALVEAFWKSGLDYVENPDDLDQILSGLDEVRVEAYED